MPQSAPRRIGLLSVKFGEKGIEKRVAQQNNALFSEGQVKRGDQKVWRSVERISFLSLPEHRRSILPQNKPTLEKEINEKGSIKARTGTNQLAAA